MKKLLILLMGFLMLAMPLSADALLFSGTDAGGIGSATMIFDGLGTKYWKVTIDNTSPVTVEGSTAANAPAITGFGFDLEVPAYIDDWRLYADSDSSPGESIGGDNDSTDPWWYRGSESIGSIALEHFWNTSGHNIKGGLYNPDWVGATSPPLGADPNYFTTAILEIWWKDVASLKEFVESDPPDGSPFVRMQNVGLGGEGSLKLFEGSSPVPEPATMLLLGTGLVGFAVFGRKKFFKKD